MDTRARVYVRTGIIGTWAVFIGVALALTASRLLAVFDQPTTASPLASAGLPLSSMLWDAVLRLYDGGTVSVIIGLVLVFFGWYQLLKHK